LVLNEGGEGAPLGQIVDIGQEVERFLRYLAEDAGIEIGRRDWVAHDFENASVRFDVEAPKGLDASAIDAFNRKFDYVATYDPAKARPIEGVRHVTMLQYAKAASALAAHEKMSFGLYRPDGKKPYEYRQLSKLRAVELQQKLTEKMRFKTTIQGTIHDLGVEEHYFSLRERKSGRLIRCDFSPKQYERVHEVAKKPNALIYVRGIVQQRRVDRFIESMKVELLKEAPTAPNVFTSLFGQYPDFTGALSTVEFVDQQWGTEN
jgi:hypothetical protein